MGLRKGKGGGGGGGGGGANIRTIIIGVIAIVIAIIMLGIATGIVDTLLVSYTALGAGANATGMTWADFPGASPMLQLFPLLMLIALVLFGGVLVWIGYSGQAMDAKGTIMTTIVVVVAVIMMPLVIDTVAGQLGASYTTTFTGLDQFLSLVPLLYVIGSLAITGMLGFRAVRGKIPGG
jgi:hypothetical protein